MFQYRSLSSFDFVIPPTHPSDRPRPPEFQLRSRPDQRVAPRTAIHVPVPHGRSVNEALHPFLNPVVERSVGARLDLDLDSLADQRISFLGKDGTKYP